MKKCSRFLFCLLACSALLFTSCDRDDDPIENEEELITTLVLTCEPVWKVGQL